MERSLRHVQRVLLATVLLSAGIALGCSQQPSVSLPWGDSSQFHDDEDYVSALGSWVSDSDGGIFSDIRLNTADISCIRSQALCNEARAYVNERSGNLLVQTFQYEIKNWTTQEVVAGLANPTARFELRFDRVRKLVTATQSEIAGTTAYAHLGGGEEAMAASRRRP